MNEQNHNPRSTNNEPIVNKIASSGLITLSLEDFYAPGERIGLDIAPWLFEGMILREKDFREAIKQHDWLQYNDALVYVHCSADAIIPQWAYMLLGSQLINARKVVYGNREMLESQLMDEVINQSDLEQYRDKRLIIKGCGHLPVPPHAYLRLVQVLQPLAQTIMYGEACSTVPVFKRRKN